jgi:8-amino-7-oxononanoate synthase
MTWRAWAEDEACAIRRAGRWRTVRDLDGRGPRGTLADGRPVVSFASNDYLGLTSHPAVIAAAQDAAGRWGAGAGSARLITGSRPIHSRLESALAEWKGVEQALLFSSGFAANLGVLTALGDPDVLVCSDERNHASIIDGCRLARARVAVYRHVDLDHLDSLLTAAERAIVVSETVFSMDGDTAPMAELADVCRRRGALLVLDEAHGVLGPYVDPSGDVLLVGTLSKALGSVGGFVAGPAPFVELLRNRARSFIFTTAMPPADCAAALAALCVVRSAEGEALRGRLRRHLELVAPGRRAPIVPVVLGEEERTLEASEWLLARGLLVPGIRPPTVPPGSCRLRVTLSAAHTDEEVSRLLAALDALWTSQPNARPA